MVFMEITAIGNRTATGTRTACVLADLQTWPSLFSDALEALDFSVNGCHDLNKLFEACRDTDAGLIIIAQPDPAGAVRACRVTDNVGGLPIMVVMPRESDLIPVLDAGADDAVVARAEPAVFIARVRALLRRAQPATIANNTIAIRELTINLERYHVYLQGESINLTPTEFRILAVLAKQAGRVVDPRALLAAVHQHEYGEKDAQNLVKVHIANLRRKMGDDSRSDDPYILCVRGFGYMLERRGRIRQDDPLAPLIDNR
jgi:DNA-binding response OmpR family regulator